MGQIPLHFPLIIGLQELKTTHFVTMVTMNVIQPDYQWVISLPHEGKGGVALLYHPSLKLIDSGTMNHGRATWAQLQLDSTVISIVVDSPRAQAYL